VTHRQLGLRIAFVVAAVVAVALAVVTRPGKSDVPASLSVRDAAQADAPRPVRARSAPAETTPEPPPETPPRPRMTEVVATVVKADGSPAAGATVFLVERSEFWCEPLLPCRPASFRAECDATGSARLTVPAGADVWAMAWCGDEAGSSGRVAEGSAGSAVNLELEPASPLRGRVVAKDGSGAAGATVTRVLERFEDHAFLDTTTRPDGTFEFPPVSSSGGMAFSSGTLIVRARGFPVLTWESRLNEIQGEGVRIELPSGPMLRGRLVTTAGAPVAQFLVKYADGRARTDTGGDGRFDLPLVGADGDVLATWFLLTWGHPTGRRVAWSKIPAAPHVLGRFGERGGDIDLGDVVLEAGSPIRGVVVDGEGSPVPGAQLQFDLAGETLGWVYAGREDGRFESPALSSEEHDVSVDDGFSRMGWVGRTTKLRLRGGAADVRIVLAGGRAVVMRFADARTHAAIPASDLGTFRVTGTRRGGMETFDSSDRGWNLDAVRVALPCEGAWDLTVEAPGYEPVTVEGVDVRADRDAAVKVPLTKRAN
jgi:hypothetical protein